jgi:hypothetical protein
MRTRAQDRLLARCSPHIIIWFRRRTLCVFPPSSLRVLLLERRRGLLRAGAFGADGMEDCACFVGVVQHGPVSGDDQCPRTFR